MFGKHEQNGTFCGAGTHDTFYSEPDILFVSTHQRGTFPFTGKHSETGKGDGEGASINIPLPGASQSLGQHHSSQSFTAATTSVKTMESRRRTTAITCQIRDPEHGLVVSAQLRASARANVVSATSVH